MYVHPMISDFAVFGVTVMTGLAFARALLMSVLTGVLFMGTLHLAPVWVENDAFVPFVFLLFITGFMTVMTVYTWSLKD